MLPVPVKDRPVPPQGRQSLSSGSVFKLPAYYECSEDYKIHKKKVSVRRERLSPGARGDTYTATRNPSNGSYRVSDTGNDSPRTLQTGPSQITALMNRHVCCPLGRPCRAVRVTQYSTQGSTVTSSRGNTTPKTPVTPLCQQRYM